MADPLPNQPDGVAVDPKQAEIDAAEAQVKAEQDAVETQHIQMLYQMFDKFTLNDQRAFYRSAVKKNRTAASQVNKIRALFALLTGLASAMAGLLVAATPPELCLVGDKPPAQVAPATSTPSFEATLEPGAAAQAVVEAARESVAPTDFGCTLTARLVPLLLIMSVVAPALGGAYTTLADLYQWDKLINIYDAALENIEIADAKSPIDNMSLPKYKAQFKGYAEGTLSVMRDETAQWGQVIRTPKQIDQFVEEELKRANENTQQMTVEQAKDAILSELDGVRDATNQAKEMIKELHEKFKKDSEAGAAVPPPPAEQNPADPGNNNPGS